MKLSLAESSDDDLEGRDDDTDNNMDVEGESTQAVTTPSSPSYANNNVVHSAAVAATSSSSSLSAASFAMSPSSPPLCTPIGECEVCPPKWKVMIEKEEQNIKGEYESCIEFGRRMQFECTVLLQANDASEKFARNIPEYRSCQFTDSDEQFRMFQMQLICLLVGVWSLRNVRRQRVVSASLFDQRRMRIQGSSNSGGVHGSSNSTSNGNYSSRLRNNSFELTRQQNQQKLTGYAKVPKSPAPDFNGLNSNNMQTV